MGDTNRKTSRRLRARARRHFSYIAQRFVHHSRLNHVRMLAKSFGGSSWTSSATFVGETPHSVMSLWRFSAGLEISSRWSSIVALSAWSFSRMGASDMDPTALCSPHAFHCQFLDPLNIHTREYVCTHDAKPLSLRESPPPAILLLLSRLLILALLARPLLPLRRLVLRQREGEPRRNGVIWK